MTKQNFDVNKLRVASPCSVGWETMSGDERKRFCGSCQLNVYNFAEMTKAEVQNLIENAEGRICGQLFLRADGTVLTKDCPVGIRAFYKRTARFAGATLTTILALFSFGLGQSKSKKGNACKNTSPGKILSIESRGLNLIDGTISDLNCTAVPSAKITLISEKTKREYKAVSNKKGYFRILLVTPGRYTYKVEAEGFNPYTKDLEVNENESLQASVSLDVGSFIGVIVVTDGKTMIDPKSSGNTFKITREMIDKLPH